jgi:hypothetical protein
MKSHLDRSSASPWILGLVVCLVGAMNGPVAADELVVCESSVPYLSKIPYVNRLFKTRTVICGPEAARHEMCPERCERVGIDFDCDDACEPGCPTKANCCRRPVEQSAAEMAMIVCRSVVEVAEEACAEAADRERDLIASLLELTHESAAATAALEVWKESAANEAKLRQELVQAQVCNAQLAAKLRVAEEKQELAGKLHQAQMEIATLRVELAEARLAAGGSRARNPKVAESYQPVPR